MIHPAAKPNHPTPHVRDTIEQCGEFSFVA